MKKIALVLQNSLIISLLSFAPIAAFAAEFSYGYQLALLDERAQNPQKVLLQQKLAPANATIREFEWILETLRNRCLDPQNVIVTDLVKAWRTVQRNGHKVTLLQFSRQIADLSNIAFQSRRNQKFAFSRLIYKVLKDKYPSKK